MLSFFPALAQEKLAHATSAFGLRINADYASADSVQWIGNGVAVQVCYDARWTYEVDCRLWQRRDDGASDGPLYSLSDVLGVAGFDLASRLAFQASTPERLIRALEQIARLLLEYGGPYLRNEPGAFEELAGQQTVDAMAYADEIASKHFRAAASEAWSKRDYRTLVELSRKREAQLTPYERLRLAYAAKHLHPQV